MDSNQEVSIPPYFCWNRSVKKAVAQLHFYTHFPLKFQSETCKNTRQKKFSTAS